MATLLLEQLASAESIFRAVVAGSEPMFEDIPIEYVEPDPNHKRHWRYATDNDKVMAHIFKPDYVLAAFEKVVVPLFSEVYGFSVPKEQRHEFALQLVQATCTYLLFHELFHPVFCPKSKTDRENRSKDRYCPLS